jgi:site-specific recombinase XerD
MVREWEAKDRVIQEVPPPEPKTLQSAWESFIADGTARGLREPTIKKYGYFRKRMETFAKDRGLRFLIEFDVETLTQFRATWNSQNLSALKKLELLRAFFEFCHDQEWIEKNPARKIKNPKITHRPTLPFTQDEVLRTLVACDELQGSLLTRLRLRALVLLLRFSGLRIGDAVTLARDRIQGEKLFLYTAKTGTPVYLPLPDVLLKALETRYPPIPPITFGLASVNPKQPSQIGSANWRNCSQRPRLRMDTRIGSGTRLPQSYF